MSLKKIIIGRREHVSFPDFAIQHVEAKVDTGAYSSAIHCEKANVVTKNGKQVLHCFLLSPDDEQYKAEGYYFDSYRQKVIKNSFGQSGERYIIAASIVLGSKRIQTDFSLSDRSKLKYPILLGRKFLRGHFVVDVALKNQIVKK